jgi:hypothetical protein
MQVHIPNTIATSCLRSRPQRAALPRRCIIRCRLRLCVVFAATECLPR